MMNIEIPPNGRVFISGKTGSGKTYLAKRLLRDVRRLVVMDIKNNLADDMQLVPATKRNWRRFLRGDDMRLQVTSPMLATSGFASFYDEEFRRAFFAADLIVYIDEIYGITQGSNALSPFFTALYTRGREAVIDEKKNRIVSGNIGVVACAQRPSRIPMFCMTESEHFFIFRLTDPDDRKRLSEYTGEVVREPIPDPHGFYYYSHDIEKPVYVSELPETS